MAEVSAVLNAGSSSVKFSLFIIRDDQEELLVRGQADGAEQRLQRLRVPGIGDQDLGPLGTRREHLFDQ